MRKVFKDTGCGDNMRYECWGPGLAVLMANCDRFNGFCSVLAFEEYCPEDYDPKNRTCRGERVGRQCVDHNSGRAQMVKERMKLKIYDPLPDNGDIAFPLPHNDWSNVSLH